MKAALIDFDETIVRVDLLTWGIAERQEPNNLQKNGLSPLVKRINLLKGLTTARICLELDKNDFLMPGAVELFKYLKKNNIISILTSGNILPILEYYQRKLGITYVVGSKPKMNSDIILGISEDDYSCQNFKLVDAVKILEEHGITHKDVFAVGDSPVDRTIFEFAQIAFAINPKEGIERYASYVIRDLSEIIGILGEP